MNATSARAPFRNRLVSAPSETNAKKVQQANRKVLRLKAVGFKPHPSPMLRGGDDEHSHQFSFKVLADMAFKEALGDDVLSEQGWSRVNPRGRKLQGPVIDAIEQTWKDFPNEFYRINRGVVLSADSVTWDKSTGIVEITFTDRAKHGVLDGAHSLAKIVDDLIPATYGASEDSEDQPDSLDESGEEVSPSDETTTDRFLACEVWVGLSLEEVVRLTSGRNTSRTVPPFAIANLRGDFNEVRTTLERIHPEYAKKVAFKPNEHIEPLTEEDEQNYKPVSALDILQLMMCMDVTNYNETDQPIEAYKNQGFIPRFWDPQNDRNRIAEYKKMLPVLGDLLELYDKLREVIPEVYDARTTHLSKIPRRWNKVLAKKKKPVDNTKREVLYYLDPTGQKKAFRSPTALFYPMMCAFRACLRANGKYEWVGGRKPTAWSDDKFRAACLNLGVTIASLAKPKDSLHAVGRDEAVWTACYKTIDSFLFEYGIKSKRA